MLYPIVPHDFDRLAEIFAPLEFHLAVPAALAGQVPCEVLADQPDNPRSALLQAGQRLFLGGDPRNEAFLADIANWFAERYLPDGLRQGVEAFSVFYAPGWEEAAGQILAAWEPILGLRAYYESSTAEATPPPALEGDLMLAPVDALLLTDTGLQNLPDLLEEMQSERESVEAFLARSFGMCARSENLLAAWCLSEYNLGARCEVGIATHPAYQRRGLATAVGRAFLWQAQEHGIELVGWHCWASNRASRATAEKLGFHLEREYPSLLVFFDPGLHLAVRGNMLIAAGEFVEAYQWLQRAVGTPGAPAWASFAAACAAVQIDAHDEAFQLLAQAISRGFADRQPYQENPHLAALRRQPQWAGIQAMLDGA